MKINDIGYNHKHDKNFFVNRPYGSKDWLFLLIKTSSIFKINGEIKHVKPNSFILFDPEYPQYYKTHNDEYIDDWFHFHPNFQEINYIKEKNIPINKICYIGESTNVANFIKNMCYEFFSNNTNREQTINLYFKLIINKLNEKIYSSSLDTINDNIHIDKLLLIREKIYQNPELDFKINDCAKKLLLSRSYFQHLYVKTFGVSISQDIISSRIKQACNLLRTTYLSIGDISSKCGYCSSSYFMKQFKEKTGLTPSTYRNSNKSILL